MGPQFFVAQVGSAIYGLGLGLENCPKNIRFFNFFPSAQKKSLWVSGQKVPGSKASQPLIYCGSKVSSGQGPSLEETHKF